jgi:hypothetical protein
MENLKIFARPDAYRRLTTPLKSQHPQKKVTKKIFEIINGKNKPDLAYMKNPVFYFLIRWAKQSNENTLILILTPLDQTKDGFNFLSDNAAFDLALKSSYPIPLFT